MGKRNPRRKICIMGGKLTGVNQKAADLRAQLESVKSGLGVDQLNEMRASSTNGNTGIGRIMQVEFNAFANARRNLDRDQSPDQLKANLFELQSHLQRWKRAKALQDQESADAPKPQTATESILSKYGIK